MKNFKKNGNKGFTLIELLVVIAIIGMLAATVLTSLGTARSKGRDAKRISDLANIRIALELYFDSYGHYPATIYPAASSELVTYGFLPKVPIDPNGVDYVYFAGKKGAGPNCLYYHLGTIMENSNAVLEDNNKSASSATGCSYSKPVTATQSGNDFNGKATDCNGSDATEQPSNCYDISS